MQLFDEEPFGPLLPIIRVKNIDEAVMIANHSQYGLQASLFGENETELFELAQKINTGSVNINAKSQRGPDIFPFIFP
jgi:glyceraldehyde-3-phosphate dehydrogenase (NADP+)